MPPKEAVKTAKTKRKKMKRKKSLLERIIDFLRLTPEQEEKLNEIEAKALHDEGWRVASYECWGCGARELHIWPPEAKEPVPENFWLRWGPAEERVRALVRPDGSFVLESFCPECQSKLDFGVAKVGIGYWQPDAEKVLPPRQR